MVLFLAILGVLDNMKMEVSIALIYNRLFECGIDSYCLFDISHLLIKNVKVITNDIGQCGNNVIRS